MLTNTLLPSDVLLLRAIGVLSLDGLEIEYEARDVFTRGFFGIQAQVLHDDIGQGHLSEGLGIFVVAVRNSGNDHFLDGFFLLMK